MQINNDQHFIQSFLNKVVDGRKITAKDRAIYNLALLYEFKRAFPEKARFIKEKDMETAVKPIPPPSNVMKNNAYTIVHASGQSIKHPMCVYRGKCGCMKPAMKKN